MVWEGLPRLKTSFLFYLKTNYKWYSYKTQYVITLNIFSLFPKSNQDGNFVLQTLMVSLRGFSLVGMPLWFIVNIGHTVWYFGQDLVKKPIPGAHMSQLLWNLSQ